MIETRPRIDPRIKERRIAVTRDAGRRRLRIIVGVVGTLTVVGGAVAAAHSALLDVDHVRITGAHQTATADIVRAARLNRHTFMVDVGAGEVRGVRGLPWIATARIERRWPGTVRIVVTERVPLAVIGDGPDVALVDGTGRVVTHVAAPPATLLRLDGLGAPPPPGAMLTGQAHAAVQLANALPVVVRPRVVSVVNDPGGLAIRLRSPDTVVQFGSTDDLPAKITALTTMLAKVNLADALTVDLRVPAAPVLTRRTGGR